MANMAPTSDMVQNINSIDCKNVRIVSIILMWMRASSEFNGIQMNFEKWFIIWILQYWIQWAHMWSVAYLFEGERSRGPDKGWWCNRDRFITNIYQFLFVWLIWRWLWWCVIVMLCVNLLSMYCTVDVRGCCVNTNKNVKILLLHDNMRGLKKNSNKKRKRHKKN